MTTTLTVLGTARDALATLGVLFEYPNDDYAGHLSGLQMLLEEVDMQASQALKRFVLETAELDLSALETLYTTTFDLGASCLPYVGAHLFEPESRDRARLMVGLRMSYRKGGYESETELPDHLAEVLRFAPKYESQEWTDLLRLVLSPALAKMGGLLKNSSNPYRHLIEVASHLCRAAAVEDSES